MTMTTIMIKVILTMIMIELMMRTAMLRKRAMLGRTRAIAIMMMRYVQIF